MWIMFKRKFVAVAQLHEDNNKNLIAYFENSRTFYAQIMRKTFYIVKNDKNFNKNKSRHNSYLQNKYEILKRTANSIISDAQG